MLANIENALDVSSTRNDFNGLELLANYGGM